MDKNEFLTGVAPVAIGMLSICGAAMQWNWFMNHRKALFVQKILGRNGARVFYVLLGLILIGLGVAVLTGAMTIQLSR